MAGPDLKIALLAGGTEVATSADPAIWLATMAAITGASAPVVSSPLDTNNPEFKGSSRSPSEPNNLGKFASELGVTEEELDGACSPTIEEPFMILDNKNWEALKQNTPPRGTGSVPGIVLAATMLLLWSRHASIGKVTSAMCNVLLSKIGNAEKNRARSLKGCPWIQVRDDGLRLNPAQVPSALKLATAFVAKKPLS